MAPDTKIRIKFLRNKKVFDKEVVLGNSKNRKISITGYEYKGIYLEPLHIELKKKLGIPSNISGVYVSSVDKQSETFYILHKTSFSSVIDNGNSDDKPLYKL